MARLHATLVLASLLLAGVWDGGRVVDIRDSRNPHPPFRDIPLGGPTRAATRDESDCALQGDFAMLRTSRSETSPTTSRRGSASVRHNPTAHCRES